MIYSYYTSHLALYINITSNMIKLTPYGTQIHEPQRTNHSTQVLLDYQLCISTFLNHFPIFVLMNQNIGNALILHIDIEGVHMFLKTWKKNQICNRHPHYIKSLALLRMVTQKCSFIN